MKRLLNSGKPQMTFFTWSFVPLSGLKLSTMSKLIIDHKLNDIISVLRSVNLIFTLKISEDVSDSLIWAFNT